MLAPARRGHHGRWLPMGNKDAVDRLDDGGGGPESQGKSWQTGSKTNLEPEGHLARR